MYGGVGTVSWIGEANEASVGGLMLWWGWGGGELKCCTAVAGGVKCEVREAMILRIAFRRGRQGKPKSPGDFAIDNVGPDHFRKDVQKVGNQRGSQWHPVSKLREDHPQCMQYPPKCES